MPLQKPKKIGPETEMGEGLYQSFRRRDCNWKIEGYRMFIVGLSARCDILCGCPLIALQLKANLWPFQLQTDTPLTAAQYTPILVFYAFLFSNWKPVRGGQIDIEASRVTKDGRRKSQFSDSPLQIFDKEDYGWRIFSPNFCIFWKKIFRQFRPGGGSMPLSSLPRWLHR